MVLRNVPSTATFEEQRVEINELAADVDTLASNPDTLQTVTDRGFTTDNPIKIENYAATAFVIEDGSTNEMFVVDSVNGKVNVGSSAGGASGIYLFHNNSGATPAITLDGATGSITNKGQLVTESILSSAALNNKGSIQFGTADAYSIGHMPNNSNLAFSQTHGGSYLFYSDASTVELEIASGGITVDGTCTVGDVVTSTIADNQFAFAIGTSAAKGGLYNHANGGYLFLRDSSSNGTLTLNGDSGSGLFTGEIKVEGSSTPSGLSSRISKYGSLLIGTSSDAVGDARCSIDSGNGNITTEGSAIVGAPDVTNASTGGVQLFASGQLRIQRDSSGTASDKRFQMYYGTTETTAITADGAAYFKSVAAKSTVNLTNETTSGKIQLSSDISGNYTGWKEKGVASGSMSQASIDSKTPMLTDFTYPNASDGMLIWSTSKIGFAAGGESPQFGVGVQMLFDSSGLALGGVRAFDRTSAVNTTTDATIKLLTNGSAEFASGTVTLAANTGVTIDDGAIDLYQATTNTATKPFKLQTDVGGTKVEKLSIQANGDINLTGIIQSNTKSAGHLELDSTGAFTSPKLKLFANTGDITTEGAITFTGQTSTAASGASATSDAFDHYEEGTWTPVYEGGGSFSCTYSQQTGHFTRIGRVVYVHGSISTASVSGTGSGPLKVAGLPFTVNNGRQPLSIRTISWGGGTFDQTPQVATFEDGNDHFEILKGSSTGTTDYVADSMSTGNNQNILHFSGFYTV